MKRKYDLYQTQNLRYELPIFNIKDHPTIKWKTRIMRKSTYPGKHIAIRIVAAKHLLNKTIKQMARKAWKTVYNNPKFKSNVLRGVHWQRLLQWNLLERSVEHDENKFEIISDFIDEIIDSDYVNQQLLKDSQEKEAQEQLQQQQQQEAVKFIQQAIKIKLEPNTTSTSNTSNNDDEDSITTITID
jgi:hypothetical protein